MKAFIIYLPDRQHSVTHAKYMVDTLRGYGIDATYFKGTDGNSTKNIFKLENREMYPYGIKNKELSKEEIEEQWLRNRLPENFWQKYIVNITEKQELSEEEILKINSPGVKGCFHSHYRLWKYCVTLEEPILIFEDDVKLYREFYPVEFRDILIVSLGKKSFTMEPYSTYLENPTGTPHSKEWRNFSMPGASGYAITPSGAKKLLKFYKHYYAPADNAINKHVVDIRITTHLMGRNTLPEEGNISMTKWLGWK